MDLHAYCPHKIMRAEEAISNIREAIQEYISALEEDQLPVPPDRFEAMLVAV